MSNFPTGTGNSFIPFLDEGEKETAIESKCPLCTGLLKYTTSNAGSNGTQWQNTSSLSFSTRNWKNILCKVRFFWRTHLYSRNI